MLQTLVNIKKYFEILQWVSVTITNISAYDEIESWKLLGGTFLPIFITFLYLCMQVTTFWYFEYTQFPSELIGLGICRDFCWSPRV